jgi:hypothetical protein
MQWSFILYVSSRIVIEIKILLIDQILDHFVRIFLLSLFNVLLRAVFLNQWDTSHCWDLTVGRVGHEVPKIMNSVTQNSLTKKLPAFGHKASH